MVILQFEHSSPLVVLLLLGVVVGGGMCRYFVVVVLCNVSVTCLACVLSFPVRRQQQAMYYCFSDHYFEWPQFLHLSLTCLLSHALLRCPLAHPLTALLS